MRILTSFVIGSAVLLSVLTEGVAAADVPATLLTIGPETTTGGSWYYPGVARFQLALTATPGAKCSFQITMSNQETGLTYAFPNPMPLAAATARYSFPFDAMPFAGTKDAPPGRYSIRLIGQATPDDGSGTAALPACNGGGVAYFTLDEKALKHPVARIDAIAFVGENANGWALAQDRSVHLHIPPVAVPCTTTMSVSDGSRPVAHTATFAIDVPAGGILVDFRQKLGSVNWKFLPEHYAVTVLASPDSNGGKKMPCLGAGMAMLDVVTGETRGVIRPHWGYKNWMDGMNTITGIYPQFGGAKCTFKVSMNPAANSKDKVALYDMVGVFDPKVRDLHVEYWNVVDPIYATYIVTITGIDPTPTQAKQGLVSCGGQAQAILKLNAPQGKFVSL
jgi:hypothetical protein